jgi:uncharacterized membrane protein
VSHRDPAHGMTRSVLEAGQRWRLLIPTRRRLPLSPGVLLGIGLGGLLDGVVLPQIWPWHHAPPGAGPAAGLAVATRGDGLVLAAAWLATAAGVWSIHRVLSCGATWSGSRLAGGLAIGGGVFILVEGLLAHHLLRLHHVRAGSAHVLAWDLGILLLGTLLVLVGSRWARRGRRELLVIPRDLGRAA